MRLAAALGYPLPAAVVSQRLNEAATEAGWQLDSTEAAPEPGGTRYRSGFTRAERLVATSVWPAPGGSVLQVMTFDDR